MQPLTVIIMRSDPHFFCTFLLFQPAFCHFIKIPPSKYNMAEGTIGRNAIPDKRCPGEALPAAPNGHKRRGDQGRGGL
ncbi:hypothetical protein HDV63DRAFT_382689 [Trichoderma sp. SZMC 28014]